MSWILFGLCSWLGVTLRPTLETVGHQSEVFLLECLALIGCPRGLKAHPSLALPPGIAKFTLWFPTRTERRTAPPAARRRRRPYAHGTSWGTVHIHSVSLISCPLRIQGTLSMPLQHSGNYKPCLAVSGTVSSLYTRQFKLEMIRDQQCNL